MVHAFLLPVKAFHLAKQRLRGDVPDTDRVRIARWMVDRVVDVLSDQPVFVACDDDAVARWATSRGLEVLWGPGLGLNGAVDQGVASVADAGFDHVTICHGDLPLPDGLASVALPNSIVLVPDRRGEGTNVVSRPVWVEMPAMYGTQSFAAHLRCAEATGLPVVIRRDAELSVDLDTIEDGRHPRVAPILRDVLGHTGSGGL